MSACVRPARTLSVRFLKRLRERWATDTRLAITQAKRRLVSIPSAPHSLPDRPSGRPHLSLNPTIIATILRLSYVDGARSQGILRISFTSPIILCIFQTSWWCDSLSYFFPAHFPQPRVCSRQFRYSLYLCWQAYTRICKARYFYP